jgi:hypothetical protein
MDDRVDTWCRKTDHSDTKKRGLRETSPRSWCSKFMMMLLRLWYIRGKPLRPSEEHYSSFLYDVLAASAEDFLGFFYYRDCGNFELVVFASKATKKAKKSNQNSGFQRKNPRALSKLWMPAPPPWPKFHLQHADDSSVNIHATKTSAFRIRKHQQIPLRRAFIKTK